MANLSQRWLASLLLRSLPLLLSVGIRGLQGIQKEETIKILMENELCSSDFPCQSCNDLSASEVHFSAKKSPLHNILGPS